MTTVLVHHTVADFSAWKAGYDAHESARRSHGCTEASVSQVAGNPNEIVIAMTFPSAGEAQGFLSDPSLKDAMAKAGVQGAPEITITEPVEALSYAGASA